MWAIQFMVIVQLIIGLVFVGVVALLVGWFLTSCARAWLRQQAGREEQQREYQAKHRQNGTALPEYGRGLCDNCETLSEKVYFLSHGGRLCENCYREFEAEAKN